MSPPFRTAVVVGGSRGLGLGVVEELVERGARVTAIARGEDGLSRLASRLDVATRVGDASAPETAREALASRPELLVLSSGTLPPMERIDRIGWDDFSKVWNQDVKAALQWAQAALVQPLARGSVVVLTSSGAAVGGSPLSGGYAPAKRASWFIARYAQQLSRTLDLGIEFRVVVPTQIVAGTGVGDTALVAYAAAQGKSKEAMAKAHPVMSPRAYGRKLIDFLQTRLQEGLVFGVRGDADPVVLETLPT